MKPIGVILAAPDEPGQEHSRRVTVDRWGRVQWWTLDGSGNMVPNALFSVHHCTEIDVNNEPCGAGPMEQPVRRLTKKEKAEQYSETMRRAFDFADEILTRDNITDKNAGIHRAAEGRPVE